MAKTKQQKHDIIRNLQDKLSRAKSVVFVSFDKLGVGENEELRKALRNDGGEFCVAKKTLLNRAIKDGQPEGLDINSFEGQVSVVFGYDDEVAPAKTVDKFRGEHEGKVDFLGGILDEKYLSAGEVGELAKLPGKSELYAKLVGSINAPVSGFANVLAGNIRSLMYALKAIEEKRS